MSTNAELKQILAEAKRIYKDEGPEAYKEQVTSLVNRAGEILTEEIKAVKDSMSEAPTAEAVNAISLLNMQNAPAKEDVLALMDAYGENYIAAQTIWQIAKLLPSSIRPPRPELKSFEQIESLKSNVEQYLEEYPNADIDIEKEIDTIF